MTVLTIICFQKAASERYYEKKVCFFLLEGMGEFSGALAENLLILLLPIFIFLPPKVSSPSLNNNFLVITQ